jgi:hypothetical protein
MKPKRLVRRRYRSVAALRWSAEAAAILLAGGRGVITAEAARGRGAGGSRNTRGCHHRVPQGAVAHENGNSEFGVCRPHQPGDRPGAGDGASGVVINFISNVDPRKLEAARSRALPVQGA